MALGNLEYKPCYVACLDVLGFAKKVKKENISGSELKILVEGMRICGSIPSNGKKSSTGNGLERTIEIKSHFFSDSIAFFIRKTEADVPHLFFIIRYLQDQLWKLGFCLRGGISVGEMYWPPDAEDQNILLGPAWIEAHELEDEIAIYPRIVVSAKVFSRLRGNHDWPEYANWRPSLKKRARDSIVEEVRSWIKDHPVAKMATTFAQYKKRLIENGGNIDAMVSYYQPKRAPRGDPDLNRFCMIFTTVFNLFHFPSWSGRNKNRCSLVLRLVHCCFSRLDRYGNPGIKGPHF